MTPLDQPPPRSPSDIHPRSPPHPHVSAAGDQSGRRPPPREPPTPSGAQHRPRPPTRPCAGTGILTRRTMPCQGGVLYSTVSSARSPASTPCRTKCSRWPFETGTRFLDGPPAVGPQGEPATLDPGLVPAVDALTPLRRSSYPPWRIT